MRSNCRRDAARCALTFAVAAISAWGGEVRAADQTWVIAAGSAWFTNSNWSGSPFPGQKTTTNPNNADTAYFREVPNINTGIGINMSDSANTGGSSSSTGGFTLGRIVTSARDRTIGNSSGARSGVLSLNGVGGVVLSNETAGTTLTIRDLVNSGVGQTLSLAFPNGGEVNAVGNVVLASALLSTGTGTLNKTGTGTLTLSNSGNTYAGATTVTGGTLALKHATSTNNIAASPVIDVRSGATLDVTAMASGFALASGQTLKGSGAVAGNVSVGSGTLAPGSSPGTLTVTGDLALVAGSTYAYEINGTDDTVGGGVNDLAQVNGNLTLDGTANVSASPALDNFGFRSYRMFNYTGTLTDNGVVVGSTPSANYLYSVNTSTAGQVNLDVRQKAKIGTVSSPGAAVIKGGVTPVSILVENASPTGSATLSFSATNLYTGLTGAGSGTAAPQTTGTGALTYDSTGAAFGVQNLGFTVTGDGATTQGGDVNGTIAVTVLDHSSASFDGAGQKTLAIDLGTVGTNAGGGTFSSFFDIFADLAPSGYTAGLDLDYVTSSGDVGTLSLAGMTSFANLAAGGQKNYGIAFDTTQNGSFSATYVFHLSDQDLAGASAAGSDVITLTVTGTVVPLPVSTWMGVGLLGGLVAVRRLRRGRVTESVFNRS